MKLTNCKGGFLMAKVPVNFRLEEVYIDLLEEMIKKFESQGDVRNKTDLVQRAIYSYALDYVLDRDKIDEVIDRHHK